MSAWMVMVMDGSSDERGKAVEGSDEACDGLEEEGRFQSQRRGGLSIAKKSMRPARGGPTMGRAEAKGGYLWGVQGWR